MRTTPLARTYLYVPADRPDRFAKALSCGADAVILDLEDGVADAAKDDAVGHLATLLSEPQPTPCWVRLDNRRWATDLPALAGPGLDGVVVPKAESTAQLTAVAEALGAVEGRLGLDDGSLRMLPLVESPVGVAALSEIAGAPRVLRLGMGEADLRASLVVRPRLDGLDLLHVRSSVVIASAVAGIAPPVASTSTDVRDLTGLSASTALLRDLGFTARTTIHPAQVPIVAAALAPTEQEIVRARAVVAAFEQARSTRLGVSTVDGGLVDLAVVRAAWAVLDRIEP